MIIEEVIANRLQGLTAVNDALDGHIFPEYRDDVVPSIVFDLNVFDVDGWYEGTGPVDYELTVSVIAHKQITAAQIGDMVIDGLDRTSWTDGNYSVIYCGYKDRDPDYIDKASKNKRLAVLDLRFDLTVDGATAT